MGYLVGVDLGGTNLRIRLCTPDGLLRLEHKEAVVTGDSEATILALCQGIEALVSEAQVVGPLQIGVAIAGMLDPSGMIVRNAPNLKWRDVPLVEALQARLSLPHQVRLFNDLDAAAFGEFVHWEGEGATDLACVFVGSGVGCGLVLGGQLYTGSARLAGEFGHVKVVVEGGRLCGCGQRGCLEAYAGGHALGAIAQELASTRPAGSRELEDDATLSGASSDFLLARAQDIGLQALSSQDLIAGAAAGDVACQEKVAQAASFLGRALADLVTLLNPSHLILGGGVLLGAPSFWQQTLAVFEEHCSPLARAVLQIHPAKLGDDAGMLGAIALIQRT